MGEIKDNLFHCSAYWNTQKTCADNSVDEILQCRPSYTHAEQRYLVSAILFLKDWGERDLVCMKSCNFS